MSTAPIGLVALVALRTAPAGLLALVALGGLAVVLAFITAGNLFATGFRGDFNVLAAFGAGTFAAFIVASLLTMITMMARTRREAHKA